MQLVCLNSNTYKVLVKNCDSVTEFRIYAYVVQLYYIDRPTAFHVYTRRRLYSFTRSMTQSRETFLKLDSAVNWLTEGGAK